MAKRDLNIFILLRQNKLVVLPAHYVGNIRNLVMEETWESLFVKQAKAERHSQAFIDACLAYATELQSRNLPVLFNGSHLAQYVGLSEWRYSLITRSHLNCYDEYEIQKKHSKKKRKICAPHSDLMRAQHIIYQNILLKDSNYSENAHGFIPKNDIIAKGVYSNALPHEGCKWLLNMDLKDFFPSICYDRVLAYFKSLGYEDEVSIGLTELCTFHMRLPQGAPTSPMLSNLIAKRLDADCKNLASRKGCQYTRYADDLTFSGQYVENRVTADEVTAIIFKNGFKVNRQKTKEKIWGQRQMVTGLTVTNGVHIPKTYRKDVWMELHCCKKFGVKNHIQHMNHGKGFYKQWLLGRIMYVRSVDRACGDKMLIEFNGLKWV